MRNTVEKWALCAVGVSAIAFGAPGCDPGCGYDATCLPFNGVLSVSTSGDGGASGSGGAGGSGSGGGTGTDSGIACPEDPADGAVAEECGIWVRASLPGDDASPGTQAAPVSTLAKAIALAGAGSKRVYACGEVYAEHVDLPAGIALFGGFDCDQGWAYVGTARRATIAPTVPGVFALTLLNGDDKSLIGEVHAEAMSAADAGGSSVAVFAMDYAMAEIRRSGITAGNGADGADGADGDHDGAAAQKGLPGNSGASACEMDIGLGGAVIALDCGDGGGSNGGQGGDASEAGANGGGDGQFAPAPNPQNLGAGGKGENVAQGLACTSGIGGAQGFDGVAGLGAQFSKGQLTMAGQVLGMAGGDGAPGTPGQGGGGGGASLGKAICGGAPHGGAGGGSGGTGGCGGKGGKGGQAGGSSIGIATRGGTVEVHDVVITTGQGGNGGNGGKLQSGAQGGLPGIGGNSFGGGPDPAKKGCAGGVGGYGGNGGHGGGGHGGHSASVAFTSKSNVATGPKVVHNFGKAGKGGAGGNPIPYTGHGNDGTASTGVLLEP